MSDSVSRSQIFASLGADSKALSDSAWYSPSQCRLLLLLKSDRLTMTQCQAFTYRDSLDQNILSVEGLTIDSYLVESLDRLTPLGTGKLSMMGQEKIGIMLSQPLTRSLFEEVSGFSGWIVVRCENNPFSSTNVEYILSEISKNKNNQFSITRWEGDSISFIFDENYMAISYQIDSDHYWQAKSRSIFLGKSRYSFCCGYCRRWHYFNRSQTIPRKKGFEIISDILIHGELSAKWHGENRSRSQDFAEEKARLMASSR